MSASTCTCTSTCLNLFIQVGGFRLIIGQVGLESFDLLFLVTHGFVERLELLADPPVALLLRRELVAAALLGVQLLAALLGQCQSAAKTHMRYIASYTYPSQ